MKKLFRIKECTDRLEAYLKDDYVDTGHMI